MRDEVIHSSSDPLGYYALLGIGPLADASEIRTAYRVMAKRLHPDLNLSETAELDFIELTTAYRILKDPKRRARYDATAHTANPATLINPHDQRPSPMPCSRCGKVTAQTRYIAFEQVKTFLFACRRQVIRGIFCRDCADRTAIRTSTVTWICGWWGPTGPWHSLKALWLNMRGGFLPRVDNLWLLLHQARAFQLTDEPDIARSLAEQAQTFAKNDEERQRIADIIATTARRTDGTQRRLKNRWTAWRYATWMQLLPFLGLALAILIVGTALLFRGQTESVSAAITIHPAEAGEYRHVAVEALKVRLGPRKTDPVVALLDRFTTVQVMDSASDGEWSRILTPTGVTGYVPARFLFGGTGEAAKTRWCAEQDDGPTKTGDVLMRRSGGEYRLSVHNATGADVVVRLKTPTGRTLLSFFMAKGTDGLVDGIPDGTFRAVFATGKDFSRACAVFLDDMQTFIVPAAQTFQAHTRNGRRTDLTLTLPPVGEGSGQSHPLPIEDFLDS
jgi:curved DNA-binding protein CbpA